MSRAFPVQKRRKTIRRRSKSRRRKSNSEKQLRKLPRPCAYRPTRDRADITRRLCDLEAKERRYKDKYEAVIKENQKNLDQVGDWTRKNLEKLEEELSELHAFDHYPIN